MCVKIKKTPRPRQVAAYKSIINAWRQGETPYADCVTGFGKSLVLAMLMEQCLKQGKRCLVLVPKQELVEQNYREAVGYEVRNVGICCAALNRDETHRPAVIATNTSFVKRRTQSGRFDMLLIDEADLVSPKEHSTYRMIERSLRRLNPKLLVAGVTGSPYRQDQGMLHWHPPKKDGKPTGTRLFTSCCYAVGVDYSIGEMIRDGHLSPVETLNTHTHADLSDVKIRGKDFDQAQCGVKFGAILAPAVAETRALFEEHGIETALIFASTLENGRAIVEEFGDSEVCRLAHSDMNSTERVEIVEWIKRGNGKRYLVNVGLYTRGFDMPHLQCIVLLRATLSLRLYVQIIGRILRTHESKEYGYLIDFGQHADRFGPIDNLQPPKKKRFGEAPKKACLMCHTVNRLSAKECSNCGALFVSDDETGNYSMKTKAQVLEEKRKAETECHEVDGVLYMAAFSRKDGTPMVKMIFYDEDKRGIHEHYLCLDNTGPARDISRRFALSLFRNPADFYELGQAGVTVENMLALLNSAEANQYFKTIRAIEIGPEGKYKRITKVIFND